MDNMSERLKELGVTDDEIETFMQMVVNNANSSSPPTSCIQPPNPGLGYLKYTLGAPFGPTHCGKTYTLIELLGYGTFGQVFKLRDQKKREVALKVVRNSDHFKKSGLREVKCLNALTEIDPEQNYVFSRINFHFELDGHICFSQRLLGMNIHNFLKKNNKNPFPIYQIRHIMYQLVHTLRFLHEKKFVHTDIKLDNVVFVNSAYDEIEENGNKYLLVRDTRVCLIDFGIARRGTGIFQGKVSPRISRAPEIYLVKKWDFSVDIWCLGCALYKLFNGNYMFHGESEIEQMFLMENLIGKFPANWSQSKLGYIHFINGFVDVKRLQPGREIVLREDIEVVKKAFTNNLGEPDVRDLLNLLFSMLKLLPHERLTAEEILKHKFFHKLTSYEKLRHGIANEEIKIHKSGHVSGINCSCVYCINFKGLKVEAKLMSCTHNCK